MSSRDIFTRVNADNAVLNGLTKFQGFYSNVYRDPFVGGTAFMFITKPLLFIDPNRGGTAEYSNMAFLNMTRDPLFSQYIADEVLNNADKKIAELLSYQTEYSSSSFLPMFTNECKRFDATDVTMEQHESFETKQGFKESLPTFKSASEAAGSLSISVTEDSNLSFTKMMTLWVNYISNITDGTFDANPDMILNGTLDYVSSIYYFVLGPDGKTLKYWSKYTGCWPTTIPFSNLSYSKGQNDISDLTLNFAYSVKEDMNPKILEEFNITALRLSGTPIIEDKKYIKEMNGQYSSIKNSPLLNLNNLYTIPGANILLKSETRDPIVIYVPGNNLGIYSDTTADRFELIFDDYGYKEKILPDIFGGDNYFINDSASNYVKKGYIDSLWDKTDFWDEETIE